ncbi:hypothetical protein BGX28_009979 [Mortierella sp. GBA30]|nr:hypothetical protein BGX28_009979 [Mortierella sp. GBA30]
MADRASNPTSLRAPLQEYTTQSINVQRRPSLTNITNRSHVSVNTYGHDNGATKATFVAPFALRGGTLNAVNLDDKDTLRTRVALQQKPLTSSTANVKFLQPTSNPPLKSKQSSFTAATAFPPSKYPTQQYPVRETGTIQTHAYQGLSNTASMQPSRKDIVQAQHLQYTAKHLAHLYPSKDNAALQAHTQSEIQTQTPQEHNAKAQSIAQDPLQLQPQSQFEYGSPEWIGSLLQTLPTCRFYFDCFDQATSTRLTKVLQFYNARVTTFFSADVTHVVTTNYIPRSKDGATRAKTATQTPNASSLLPVIPGRLPLKQTIPPPNPSAEANILVKALGFGIKIWSLERLVNLLKPLMGGKVFKDGSHIENRNLESLLHHEKVYGLTTTQNDDSPRAEYYVLKGHYVMVEDATGHYRTILAHEFPNEPPKSGGSPWPRLYVQHHSRRSPFVFAHDRSKLAKKPEATVNDMGQTNKSAKEEQGTPVEAEAPATACDMQRAPSVLASGIINSVTSNVNSIASNTVSTNSAIGKPATVHGMQLMQSTQDRVLEQLGKRVLNATKAEAGVTPSAKVTEFLRPADVVRTSKTLTTVDQGSQKQSKSSAQPVGGNVAAMVTSKLPAKENASRVTVPMDYRNKGYCENCRQLYDDFNAHTATPEHRRYAHDSSKFAQLDNLLTALQRKPKKPKATSVQVEAKITSDTSGAERENLMMKDSNRDMLSSVSTIDSKLPPVVEAQQSIQKEVESPSEQRSLECDRSKKAPCPSKNAAAHNSEREVVEVVRSRTNRSQNESLEPTVKEVVVQVEVQSNKGSSYKRTGARINEGDSEDVEDQLSSEMSRLDVAEGDNAVPMVAENEIPQTPLVRTPPALDMVSGAPRKMKDVALLSTSSDLLQAKPAFHDRLRLPYSDMGSMSENCASLVSQTGTDATQPDERFLECSGIVTQSASLPTDPVPQIELAITLTDGPEAFEDVGTDAFPEETNESDKEGSDDAVDLLKSPSAGRGAYAKAQGAMIRQSLELPVTNSRGMTSGLYKGTLKRKLENILAEERSCDWSPRDFVNNNNSSAPHTPGTPTPQTLSTRPMVYDDSLRSRLLQQQSTPQQHSPLRPMSWPHPRQPSSLPLPPAPPSFSSPQQQQRFGQQRHAHKHSPRNQNQRHVATDDTSDTIPLPSYGGSEADGSTLQRYDADVLTLSSSTGYPSTPLAQRGSHNNVFHNDQHHHYQQLQQLQQQQQQQQQQRYLHQQSYSSYNHSTATPHAHRPSTPRYPSQYSRPGIEISVNESAFSTGRSGSAAPTTPTSPVHRHNDHRRETLPPGSLSPVESTYSASVYSSPSRSPSQRSRFYRMQIPTMSHAEQERERCYHHYRGNRLPEPAGQKKVKSSSGLEEEFEEYGEGCMVFIE